MIFSRNRIGVFWVDFRCRTLVSACFILGFIAGCSASEKMVENQNNACIEVASQADGLMRMPQPIPDWYSIETYNENLKKFKKLIDESASGCEKSREWLLSASDIYTKYAKYEEALRYGNLALEMKPMDAVANHLLGNIYSLMHEYNNGLDLIARSVKLDPDQVGYWLNYCYFQEEAGWHKDAISTCEKTADLKNISGLLKGQALHTKARAHLALGEVAEARLAYEAAKAFGYDFPPIVFEDE